MAKWQGTVVPNEGYVEKVYFNTNLSVDEVVNLLNNIDYTIYNAEGMGENSYNILYVHNAEVGASIYPIMKLGEIYAIASGGFFYFCSKQIPEYGINFTGWNPEFNGVIEINGEVFPKDFHNNISGEQNDKLTSLVSTTPFTQPTTADKLQKLIDGKQYVVDKVNAKAGTDLKINSTWGELGDTIESISGGETERSLKKLLDYTKSSNRMFYENTNITDLTGYFNYNDTENVEQMTYMFYKCSNLMTLPPLNTGNVNTMDYMFYGCTNLTTIEHLDTKNVNTLYETFRSCSNLISIPQLDIGKVEKMQSAFHYCYSLQEIDLINYNLSNNSMASKYMFSNCYSLKTVIIRSFVNYRSLNSLAFQYCYHFLGTTDETYNPDGLKDGYIYVPRNMVDTLKSATNWSVYADQIRALEDYTVDGTTTGELDESKVNGLFPVYATDENGNTSRVIAVDENGNTSQVIYEEVV